MKSQDYRKLKAPPIPIVSRRHTCQWCQKPMPVCINYANDEGRHYAIVTRLEYNKGEIVSWRYSGYGHFCTLRCATSFANDYIDNHGLNH